MIAQPALFLIWYHSLTRTPPVLCLAIWFQNSSLYHFSMFHASHHITPVPATEDEASCLLYMLLFIFENLLLCITFLHIVCLADRSWSSCCEVCNRAYVPIENSSRQSCFNFNRRSSWMLAGHFLLTYGDIAITFLDFSNA